MDADRLQALICEYDDDVLLVSISAQHICGPVGLVVCKQEVPRQALARPHVASRSQGSRWGDRRLCAALRRARRRDRQVSRVDVAHVEATLRPCNAVLGGRPHDLMHSAPIATGVDHPKR